MKILKKDLKRGEIKIKIENADDIWNLSQLIEENDKIKGSTERKIKIGDASSDRNIKVVRKKVFLEIKAEKIDISDDSILKILGVITQGPDDVARGEHHSFNLGINDVFTIIKEQWLKFQLKKIEECAKGKQIKLLMVIFDREEAYFAKLKGNGYDIISKIKGDVAKKEEKHNSKDNFYQEIIKKIQEQDNNEKYEHIIIASPGFWKENLLKVLPEELKKKTISATVSQANQRAFEELLKRDELNKVLQASRAAQESKLIEKLLAAVANEKASYGLKEVKQKTNEGNIKELLITNKFLKKTREENKYQETEKIMITAEQMDGTIHVISTEEAAKTLDSLTGLAGILRWKS